MWEIGLLLRKMIHNYISLSLSFSPIMGNVRTYTYQLISSDND